VMHLPDSVSAANYGGQTVCKVYRAPTIIISLPKSTEQESMQSQPKSVYPDRRMISERLTATNVIIADVMLHTCSQPLTVIY
jgi:hypothetical protein